MSASNILLILAAGKSRRFGRDKRFEAMPKGGPILPALVRRGKKAGLRVVVVLDESDDVSERIDAEVILSKHASRGMGCSLADAILELRKRLSPLPDSVLVVPADLPLLRINSLREVASRAGAGAIVVPRWQGQRGHPVAIGRDFWSELTTLEGDIGARDILAANAEHVIDVELDDPGICQDGDTPEAMSALFAKMSPP